MFNNIEATANQIVISAVTRSGFFSDNAFVKEFSSGNARFDFNTGYNYMLEHTYGFVICGILFTLLFAGILWVFSKITPTELKSSTIRLAFFFVWAYGFVVYDIGMCTGEPISLITNAPLAALYAFKIFLLDSDISEIHSTFHESWVYSLNFALAHFFAAIISTLFVLKYFGFNILAKWRMWIESHFKNVDETYVFWGFNDASEKLISSINSHYSEQKTKNSYRIILVRLNNANDDSPESRTGVGRIFDFLSIPTSELAKLQYLKCLTVGTYSKVSQVNVTNENTDILKDKLSLKSLKRIIEKRTRNKIHMLFLSDNENENLHATSLLLKDKALKYFVEDESAKVKREVIFYCHARYNSVHRVIEDSFMTGSRRVKVIDSSHISVENLKLNENLLPVNFVKVEKDASVSSSFNSLVVGFSEVGQDSVRFLYEYGAFVKTGSTDTAVVRSDFHMHVVDRCMSDVAGAFVANAPAIKVSVPFINGMKNSDSLITLNQMDCRSIEFYQNLEDWIKDLNYIVIATDNDELNITLAIRIFKMAIRYRSDMKNLCILTRVHEDEDGHIRQISEYYNRLWESQTAVKGYNGKIATQNVIKRNSTSFMPIHLFGLDSETYTYNNIIDDTFEQEAIKFKERYIASTRTDYQKPQAPSDYAWYEEVRKNIICIENDPANNPTLSAVMGIRRMQGQDYANYFHRATKHVIARKALKEAGWQGNSPWKFLRRKFETLEYIVKENESYPPHIFRILNVLAQTEHLRWIASHEILGYIGMGDIPSRDEVRMYHSCIKSWQDLSPEIQSYDFDVVDTTLNIISPDSPIEK